MGLGLDDYLGFTSPVMTNVAVLGIVLDMMEMVLWTIPTLPSLLKVTEIYASFPGGTGSLGHSGTVHPQLA